MSDVADMKIKKKKRLSGSVFQGEKKKNAKELKETKVGRISWK